MHDSEFHIPPATHPFLFHLGYLLLLFLCSSAGWAQSFTQKTGGLLFRVDDDQPIDHWQDYASVFDKYGYKFSFALNLDLIKDNAQYWALVKDLQTRGHEMVDHTPDHATHFFRSEDAGSYQGMPGVDHVAGSLVALAYDSFDTTETYFGDGLIDINDNIGISETAGAFRDLQTASPPYMGIYLPIQNLFLSFSDFSNKNTLDVDTLYLATFWGEDIHLGVQNGVPFKFISVFDVRMNPQALSLLASRTLELCNRYGVDRPYVWIQPGTQTPQITHSEAKAAYAPQNYESAATFRNVALKCYNEYDPVGEKRYAMQWGDFLEESQSFESMKHLIADKVAKHYLLIGESHFNSVPGDWSTYMARMDSLLAWCYANQNKILVHTQREWTNLLYDSPTNPYVNIMPDLKTDLDHDGYPDGYSKDSGTANGVFDSSDGVAGSAYSCFSIHDTGTICSVAGLAGLEKGENDFWFWMKGAPNTIVDVVIVPQWDNPKTFRFAIVDTGWRAYRLRDSRNGDTTLQVRSNASTADVGIRCSSFISGSVKVSGMNLHAMLNQPLRITSFAPSRIAAGGNYLYKLTVLSSQYQDVLRFFLSDSSSWLGIATDGTISGSAPQNPGVTKLIAYVADSHSDVDSQTVVVEVIPKQMLVYSTKSIVAGNLRYGSTYDTTIYIKNAGLDSVRITKLSAQPNNVQFFVTNASMVPNSACSVTLSIPVRSVGSLRNLIIVEKSGGSPADSISITGYGEILNDTGTLDQTPQKFSLAQNFPNPFNPSTSITFSLLNPSKVRLQIFNILGQEVHTLINDQMKEGGTHFAIWNGDDKNGMSVASGIYFCRLIAEPLIGGPPDIAVSKMVLVR